jgi:Flp pilus assembly protein TadG
MRFLTHSSDTRRAVTPMRRLFDVTTDTRPSRSGTRGLRRNEKGQVLPLLALVLVALLAVSALTIDLGRAYYSKRALQSSADAAALAGAQGLPNASSATQLANQYSGTAGAKNARVNIPGVLTTVSVKCLSQGASCSSNNTVVVKQSARVNSVFGKIFGISGFNVGASATACSPWPGYSELVDEANGYCPINPGPCTIGYPFSSGNPRTSVTFNESQVLRAFAPQMAGPHDTVKVWYNDEHALTLGIRQVVVKTKTGTTTTNYPLAPLSSNPGHANDPAVGTTAQSGDFAGTDPNARPMFPALYVTDLTNDPTSKTGDWQYGGSPVYPSAVFGSWKGAVKTVDRTKATEVDTMTPDADPAKNDWNLGSGADTPPSGLTNEGYGAEIRWDVSDLGLQVGHAYRLEFMVHDGDQNKTGGDSGESCLTVVVPR